MNFIDGIAISNYRSFGSEIQKIGPFSKVNIFIGKNNSGKSNILRFLLQEYSALRSHVFGSQSFSFKDNNDVHIGLTNQNIKLGVGINLNDSIKLRNYYQDLEAREISDDSISDITGLIPRIKKINSDKNNLFWMIFTGNSEQNIDESTTDNIIKLTEDLQLVDLDFLEQEIRHTEHNNKITQVGEILRQIMFDFLPRINVSLISAIRNINSTNEYDKNEFDGSGLILELAKLQDPEFDKHSQSRSLFNKIELFLQEITQSRYAKINIPFSREYIKVDLYGNGNFLPLESLGTGIHDTIILASACTILTNQIVCIEEPELHLHPFLQKQFLNYIINNTNNQYFISTHSAHLLNNSKVSIFHITLENGASIVSSAFNISDKFSICQDLGYQPSDLFQTNSIIWVEGPSDRIYLNYWIKAIDPDLIEGLHYSIMFYGGKLLSHLTPKDDESINEFISLRKLNQNLMIVMDRDKDSPTKTINSTKARIKENLVEKPELAWVTCGREIENYLNPELLLQVIKDSHPRKGVYLLQGVGQFDTVTKYVNKSGEVFTYDKLRVALRYIEVEQQPDFERLDLDKRIKTVIKFIRESNNLSEEE
jgi:predicted ATP-dependent endonuclease of OLD family